MSTWPSVLSTISDPLATDKLNAPSHSSIETGQNDAIEKLETFIGTQASAVGTLMYDIRAAASDGGGHVQGANKGGTGQTAYTKGDILAASSASVLSKLAIGSNDQALLADSNQAAGVKWGGVATATQIQNQTYVYARASVMSGSVFGVVLSQSPSILSDGLGLVIKFPAAPTTSVMALQIHTTSSGSVAARIRKTDLTNPNINEITASMIGVLEFDSVSSVFQLLNPRDQVDLTTAQSVLGVKVFSSIPQTEGGNPSADTQLARKAYVDSIAPKFGAGQTTRAVASGTGTQEVAHGLGEAPSLIKITAFLQRTGATAAEGAIISGSSTGATGETCTYMYIGVDGITGGTQVSGNIIYVKDETTDAEHVAADISAVDATNFTLNFTVLSSMGSNVDTLFIQWEAWA